MTQTAVDLPTFTMRALHSRLVDWLLDDSVDEPWRHAMVGRCEGASFGSFVRSVVNGRMVIHKRVDDLDRLFIGVAVPAQHMAVVLFELTDHQLGLSAQEVVGMAVRDLDADLAALLGGETA